jgi:hypothetical protein
MAIAITVVLRRIVLKELETDRMQKKKMLAAAYRVLDEGTWRLTRVGARKVPTHTSSAFGAVVRAREEPSTCSDGQLTCLMLY